MPVTVLLYTKNTVPIPQLWTIPVDFTRPFIRMWRPTHEQLCLQPSFRVNCAEPAGNIRGRGNGAHGSSVVTVSRSHWLLEDILVLSCSLVQAFRKKKIRTTYNHWIGLCRFLCARHLGTGGVVVRISFAIGKDKLRSSEQNSGDTLLAHVVDSADQILSIRQILPELHGVNHCK